MNMENFPTERADIDPREGIVDLIESVEGLKEKVPASIRAFISEQFQVAKEYMVPGTINMALMYLADKGFIDLESIAERSPFEIDTSDAARFIMMVSTFLVFQGVRAAIPAIQQWKEKRNERTQSQPAS